MGVDIADLGTKKLSYERFIGLVTVLPDTSLTKQAMAGCELWSVTDRLLANLIDAVNYNTYITAKAAGGKGKAPKPIKRPWEFKAKMAAGKRIKGKAVSIEEMDKLLGRRG